MPYPFRTKKANLRLLNIGSAVWFAGIMVGGIFVTRDAFRSHRFHDVLLLLIMLAGGTIVYGINRLFLTLSYRERPKVSLADIEEARRMLYGPPFDREHK